MGRGRAKAKQTKVARELKYRPIGTDLNALRAELTGSGSSPARVVEPEPVDDTDDDDPYAAYVTDDDDEDDEEPAVDRWGSAR